MSDPALLPIMFDRALYPPNANILDRPVEEFLVQMDAVRVLTHHYRHKGAAPACMLQGPFPHRLPQCRSRPC